MKRYGTVIEVKAEKLDEYKRLGGLTRCARIDQSVQPSELFDLSAQAAGWKVLPLQLFRIRGQRLCE
jgi:hypothetical protein